MKRWLIAPLLIAAIALIAAACGGDDPNDRLAAEVAALRNDLAATRQLATEALLRASLPALEVARFHDIDERINNEGLVHAADPGFLRRAEQVLSSPVWPAELQPNVDQFRAAVEAVIPPVLDNDAEAAARPALIAHANSHEFEEAVAAYFAGEPVPPPPDLGEAGERDDNAGHDEDDDIDHDE